MAEIQGYIFDVDGTLIDTFEHIVQAFESVLGQKGIAHDRDTIRAVIGLTLHDCYRALVPEGHDIDELARAHHATQQTPEMYELITVYDDLSSLLEQLRSAGCKLAVVTNRSRQSVKLIFPHVGLDSAFDCVITKDEVATPKPDPEGILTVVKQLGLKPEQVAMVGDTPIDVFASKNASLGMTIAMLHGFGSEAELRNANPDKLFASFAEMKEAI